MPDPRLKPREAAQALIRGLLKAVLELAPNAALVCLNTVDPGSAPAIRPRPRLGVTAAGRPALRWNDATWRNRPPVAWRALQPGLAAGDCALLGAGAAESAKVLVCPAIGPTGVLAGAVCIVWDKALRPPAGPRRTRLISAASRVGGQIAAVLELCAVGDEPQSARIAA